MGTTDLPEETLLGPSEGGTVLFLAGRVGSGDGKWGVQWCEVGDGPFLALALGLLTLVKALIMKLVSSQVLWRIMLAGRTSDTKH